MKRYELLFYKQLQVDQKRERQQEIKKDLELDGCTFKPKLNTRMPSNIKDRKVYETIALKNGTLYHDLSKKLEKQK